MAEVGGANVEYNGNLTSPGIYQDDYPSRYYSCPTGLNFGDQMGTGVFPWTRCTTFPYLVMIKNEYELPKTLTKLYIG